MRAMVFAFVLLCAAPAFAAPTCQTGSGDVIRCGTLGAMPVGWTAPPEQWNPHASGGIGLLPQTLVVVALLFALIALLPDFDGRRAEDWDRQENDEPRQ